MENFKPFGKQCPYGTQAFNRRQTYTSFSATARQWELNNRTGTLRENSDYENSRFGTDVSREGPLFKQREGLDTLESKDGGRVTHADDSFTYDQECQRCGKYLFNTDYPEHKLCQCNKFTESDQKCMDWIAGTRDLQGDPHVFEDKISDIKTEPTRVITPEVEEPSFSDGHSSRQRSCSPAPSDITEIYDSPESSESDIYVTDVTCNSITVTFMESSSRVGFFKQFE